MRKINKELITMIIISILIIVLYKKYYYLIWNIFLAYIPYQLSLYYGDIKNIFLKIINAFIALIFFPNTSYVYTDLIHISLLKFYNRIDGKVIYYADFLPWLKLSLIFITLLLAVKLSYLTIRNYARNIRYKNTLYVLVSILSGIAIFIGRFIRLNSWDLITNPITTTNVILAQINKENIYFILLFSFVQLYILKLFEEN